MSIATDSSDEQKEVLMKVLGYCLEGLRNEYPHKWKVILYGDLISFLHHTAILEEMPDEIIGKLDELKGWFMAELEACNAGGIN